MSGANYRDTFIAVAPDSTAERGEMPPLRAGKPTVARLQFDLIHEAPYRFTSEDVIFATSADGRALDDSVDDDERAERQRSYFEKPRACLRASPLPKQYGWGVHLDSAGRAAIYGVESNDYRRLSEDPAVRQLVAMRSRRA
ncbi:MAG: hypothetical protein JJU45_19620 [Acidimicrobiia bacterium]|nr:hypothetical protein [Acidimicrobiia bacterium]